MKHLLRLLPLLSLAPAAFSQQTVVETRDFDGEVFANLDYEDFDLDVGLMGPTDIGDGTVVFVDIDLEVEWDFQFELTNLASFADVFRYETDLLLLPEACSCSSYSSTGLGSLTIPIQPGDTVLMGAQSTTPLQWSGDDFVLGGGSGVWPWTEARLWNKPQPQVPKLTFGEGAPVPDAWVNVLASQATVTGSVRVEWIPDTLPAQVVCPGNSTSAATLAAAGDFDNLWLLQSGVPQNFNLLLTSDVASPMVPSNGICLDLGSPAFQRYPNSLSVGGAPYRIPHDPIFSGTTQNFQAWFRTPSGAQTGECIAVTFP